MLTLVYSITHSSSQHLLTHSLTPWNRALLQRLISSQPVKKFPTFYGTWRFITAFTSACHLSLSWTSSIQSIPPHPTSWRSILILSYFPSMPGSPKWFLSFRFPHQNPAYASPLPHTATYPIHLILLDFITRTILGEQYRSLTLTLLTWRIWWAPNNASMTDGI